LSHYNPRTSGPAAIMSSGKVIEATVTYSHCLRAASREDMEEWVALLQYQVEVLGDPTKVGEEHSCMSLPSGAHTIAAEMLKLGFTKLQALESLTICHRERQQTKQQSGRRNSISLKDKDQELTLQEVVLWLTKHDPSTLTPTSTHRKYDREAVKEGWLLRKKRKKKNLVCLSDQNGRKNFLF